MHHPVVGELELTGEALELPGDAGLTIIAYTVEPNSASEQALNFLASWSAQTSTANPTASSTRPTEDGMFAVVIRARTLVMTRDPMSDPPPPTKTGRPSAGSSSEVAEKTLLTEVMAAPEFARFGQLIFPNRERITDDMTVTDVGMLLPYHSNIDPAEVARTLNNMLAAPSRVLCLLSPERPSRSQRSG